MAPPPVPRSVEPSMIGVHVRTALAYAIGLWPLTCVVLLVCGLLVMAGHSASP